MGAFIIGLLAMSGGWDMQYFPHASRDDAMLATYRHVDPFSGEVFCSESRVISRQRLVPWSSVPPAEQALDAFAAMRDADASGLLSPAARVWLVRQSQGARLTPGNATDEALFDWSRRSFHDWPVE